MVCWQAFALTLYSYLLGGPRSPSIYRVPWTTAVLRTFETPTFYDVSSQFSFWQFLFGLFYFYLHCHCFDPGFALRGRVVLTCSALWHQRICLFSLFVFTSDYWTRNSMWLTVLATTFRSFRFLKTMSMPTWSPNVHAALPKPRIFVKL